MVAIVVSQALFSQPIACAQSAAEVDKITQSLSAGSKGVIQRLSTFDVLPAEEWRFHPGDIAHGEAESLDDSD